ncbi:Organelle RRM domain-containing protein 6 [Hirschfeldia incana]|nr:Organelle RRM domain-containing protein 6 [Hirschfeldia incana]
MASSSLGLVLVNPSCSGDRFLRSNFSATTCSFSSSVYSRCCWRARINVGTVMNSTRRRHDVGGLLVSGCLSSPDSSSPPSSISGPKTKLYVSGLSFRTTEDSLRNAFEQFGKLTLVNLVMDKVANRPRGFAFLRYETEEESMKAIEGMHGKFLDGRVIFVEEAKPKSDLQRAKPRPDFNKAQTKPRTFRTW